MVQMRTPIRKGRRFFTCVAKSFKPADLISGILMCNRLSVT